MSLIKLVIHNYGVIQQGDTDKRNRKAALSIFYGLALAEASFFLLEKAYWEYKVIFCKVLEKVNEDCDLGSSGMLAVRRFFYDAYSKCINGSIFDGLKMDMVSLSMDLLGSTSSDEQIMGAEILQKLAKSEKFSEDTLQKIGVSCSTVERLVEILNWKEPREEKIRIFAAEILSKLAGKKQNSLRVAGIPGSMESISSLLHIYRTQSLATEEIGERRLIPDQEHYDFWTVNNLGLVILKKLARDHENCGKIGNARDLLPKIIDFTHAEARLLKGDNVAESQIQMVKRSLQVLKRLADTTGTTGKQLRREISENVFVITNIRDILKHGEKRPELQKLGIEILTSLAMEDDATERIGGTGGILKELLNIFFKDDISEEKNHVRIAAGEALAMLALESKKNCQSILKLDALDKLVCCLEVELLCSNAARILTNLCTYGEDESFRDLRRIIPAVPIILNNIVSKETKLQEAMLGLAARALKFMNSEESSIMFERARIREETLAELLVKILKKHEYPSSMCPRIRRYTIELTIWMMREPKSIHIFKNLGLENELRNVLGTTSELESFNIFSGSVGLSRYKTSMHSLVERALKLLENSSIISQ